MLKKRAAAAARSGQNMEHMESGGQDTLQGTSGEYEEAVVEEVFPEV